MEVEVLKGALEREEAAHAVTTKEAAEQLEAVRQEATSLQVLAASSRV